MTTKTTETTAPQADTPKPVKHHWIMTVQAADGRQGTSDGSIDVVPGLHTHASTYAVVLNGMKEWIGSTNVTVLFFALSPNQI